MGDFSKAFRVQTCPNVVDDDGDDGDVDNNEMKDKQLEVSRKSFF